MLELGLLVQHLAVGFVRGVDVNRAAAVVSRLGHEEHGEYQLYDKGAAHCVQADTVGSILDDRAS